MYWDTHRRPPERATESARDCVERLRADQFEGILTPEWYERFLALRRAGKIGILLAESGCLYIAESAINPWGSKKRFTVERLCALIEFLENEEKVEGAA